MRTCGQTEGGNEDRKQERLGRDNIHKTVPCLDESIGRPLTRLWQCAGTASHDMSI